MASIREWPAEERPIERLFDQGPEALGDAELIAILVGSGARGHSAVDAARAILAGAGGLVGLGRMDRHEMTDLHGVGPVIAARILAAVEIGRRLGERRRPPDRRFRSSRDIYEAYRHRLAHLDQEVFWVVILDARHRPIREVRVAMGGLSSCGVEAREVFRPAIRAGGAKVVLLHNHPSGDPRPSRDDITISRRLVQAGRILGLEILDHLVIASEGYASLRDLKLLDDGSNPMLIFHHGKG